MTIRACAAFEAGSSLGPFTYEVCALQENDLDLEITHCGICHSDLHMINDDWRITSFPFVPGHEIVGLVKAHGSAVTGFVPGQRVGVGWQCGACHNCDSCKADQENLCRKKRATCVGRHGGFADRIVVDSRFAFPLPASLESAQAAPLLCAGVTVFSPFQQYHLERGSRVGIAGIGGLGHLALQFAKASGFLVTAISSSPQKEAETRKLGAHHFACSSEKRSIGRIKGSLDFLLVTSIGNQDWNQLLELLRPNGRLCLLGIPTEPLSLSPALLIEGQKSVCGSNTGNRNAMTKMLDFAAKHKIKSQIEVYPMTEVNEAIRRLRANQVRYRAVLQVDGSFPS